MDPKFMEALILIKEKVLDRDIMCPNCLHPFIPIEVYNNVLHILNPKDGTDDKNIPKKETKVCQKRRRKV
jgi:hypothetical protein